MLVILTFATENEKQVYEYIYHKYKRLLLYKAYDILRDHGLAEDAVSEAFLRVYRNMHKITDPDAKQTAAFLVTIAKNVALTMLARERKKQTTDLDDYGGADSFDLEAHVVAGASAEQMLGLLDKLNEDLRAVFLLKYAHDLSHREIGKMLGITENNVNVRLHRAKNKLTQLLKQEGFLYG